MAEKKQLTIYQSLGRLLNPNAPDKKKPNTKRYSLNSDEILRTASKSEYETTKLELQQDKYLSGVWKRVENGIFQQSINYETTRIGAYSDFEAMESYPEISAALDIVMEECTTLNNNGRMVNVYSESDRVKGVIEDLLYNRLDIHTSLPMWTRNVCKYGDNFVFLNLNSESGIISSKQLPNYEMERREGSLTGVLTMADIDGSNKTKFYWRDHNIDFNSWQIAHFRLLGDDRRLPYGTSFLEKARRVWKQLCLSENTNVWTKNGYNKIKNIKNGDIIYSYDYDNGNVIESKVKDCWESGEKETFRVKTLSRYIDVTDDHQILTFNDGQFKYKTSNELNIEIDYLVIPTISSVSYEKIIDITSNGVENVWDLEVDNELHNFMANGAVVHNCLSEDAMLVYRVTRAPERRVFKIYVGNLDDKDVEPYVNDIVNRFKRSSVIDPQTGQIDLRYNQLPVWKNTPIPLLDGRTLTIEELSNEWKEGKENYVYSIQDNTHQIVGGKIIWCDKNYTAEKMVKVTLDDDTYIATAPEHPFILRDGSYKRADELKENDSLMPFYTKLSSKSDGMKIEGYSMVYNPNSSKYEYTHRIIGNEYLHKEKLEVFKNTNWDKNNNLILHHKDFTKTNSLPSNLEWMGNIDHIDYHKKRGGEILTKYNKSEKKRLRNIELAKEQNWGARFVEYNHSELHSEHNKIRKEAQLKDWSNPEKKILRSKAMQVIFDDVIWDSLRVNIVSGKIKNRVTLLNHINTDLIEHIISINKNKRLNRLKSISRQVVESRINDNGFSTITEFICENKKNHKVKSIEFIQGDDVYCMTVVGPNGEDDRHNFAALSLNNDNSVSISGSFLRNSNDQDFFIPVRSEDSPNPIDTLPGACISLDTRIPLIDGRVLELSEIIEEWDNGDRNMWVYSVDPNTGESTAGPITWAGITRTNTQVLRITLGSGKEIISTPDHKFVHRKNGFVEAQDLSIGDKLMPFYSDVIDDENGSNSIVWDSAKNKWVSTQIMINNLITDNNISSITDNELSINEQIITNIEWLEDRIDTGTITVDGEEKFQTTHTFALESGIYVKNSNLDQIADIEYLQGKLFAALRVPKPFLGFDDTVGDGKNLALQDIRFSRTINRIQQTMLQELNKIVIIHLHLLGFEDDLDNFTLTLNNPSTQSEILKVEHLQTKITLYKDIVSDSGNGYGAMSMTRAKREILGWSDNEIKQDLLEQRMERAGAAELENTSKVIKHTGMYDKVDRVYGNIDKAMEGGGEDENLDKENDGGSPMGGGGGFGGGGISPEDLDFGDDDVTGDEVGDEVGGEVGDEVVGGNETGDEVVDLGNDAGDDNKPENEPLNEINKSNNLRVNKDYLQELIDSIHNNDIKNNAIPITDRNMIINEGVDKIVKDIDNLLA